MIPPTQSDREFELNQKKFVLSISGLSFLILCTSITLRLVFGNNILNNFYPYTDEGGNPILKIHPGSWVLIFGSALFIAAVGPSRLLFKLTHSSKSVGFALLSTFLLIAYSLLSWGTASTAYLLDTYLFSVLSILLATHLRQQQCFRLFHLIAFIVAINCIIAVAEYLTQTHLIPNPVTGTRFFRANALMAHPLNNALVALPIALAVLYSPIKSIWRFLMITLVFLGMVSFASRASLFVFCATVFLAVWLNAFTAKARQQTRALYILGAPVIVLILIIAASIAIFFTQLGSGISSRLEFDESAMARVEAIDFFLSLNLKDYFFGMGPSGLLTSVENLSTASIIENYWIQIVLTYGIPMFMIIFFGFAQLIRWLTPKPSLKFHLIIAAFFIASSTNNSLSTKTVALTIFILSLYLLGQINEKSTTDRAHINNHLGKR